MIERNAAKRLEGEVQMDDAYIGGLHQGTFGRGAAGKTPFVAAVSVTGDGKPDRIILRRVAGFSKIAIAKLASAAFAPGVHAVSDALACFPAVTAAGCTHTPIKTGSGVKAAKNHGSNGSTPPLATSRPQWWEPTEPCGPNMCRDTSPNSSTGSTADTGSKP